MNKFDKYIKQKAAEEGTEIPKTVKNKIEQTLTELPEKETFKKPVRVFLRSAAAAACLVFATIFVLPNISATYANTLEQIPVIGDIIRVITIRNYFYSDDYHELNVSKPEIEDEGNEALRSINQDINELTDALVQRFYDDVESIGDNGHSSLYIDYQPVTNTEKWFSLEIRVSEVAGSGNTYYKYYNVNRLSGEIVQLEDLAKDDSFYDAVEADIKRQMKSEMEKDNSLTYWIDDSVIGKDFLSLKENHNFYFDESGALVIPFDKYEVAPGFMGTPKFTVEKNVFAEHLKPEFADIIL